MTIQHPDKNQTIRVRIVSPNETIFEGQANSVSSNNSQGKFDILPYHANFITLIENSPIHVRKTDQKVLTFSFPIAIVYSRDNVVDIYTNIQISSESIKG